MIQPSDDRLAAAIEVDIVNAGKKDLWYLSFLRRGKGNSYPARDQKDVQVLSLNFLSERGALVRTQSRKRAGERYADSLKKSIINSASNSALGDFPGCVTFLGVMG